MASHFVSSIFTIIFLTTHLWFMTRPKYHFSAFKKELFWILLVFIFGLVIEILSFSGGFLYFNSNTSAQLTNTFFDYLILPPFWLLYLWLMFAVALRTCLSFLLNNAFVSVLLFITFVPFNYYAGAHLSGTVSIDEPALHSLAFITFLWLIFLGSLIKIKHYYFKGSV